MKSKKWLPLLVFLFLLLIPTQVFAIDFSITRTEIDAYLQQTGDVNVVELFEYDFNDDFNGITREIIPKDGASIVDFAAFENGKELKVEYYDDLYKIYRAGEYETIEIELNYTIKNGMEKYQDGAQFYWPFFDDRNETPYESMTITIHPPQHTDDVLALGYDTAYQKEVIHTDGTIEFKMGNVSEGSNGDIRVVYSTDLFPGMTTISSKIRPEILSEQERLAEKQARYEANQETWGNIGNVFIPMISLFFLSLIAITTIPSTLRKNGLIRDLERRAFFVPEERMSLPATAQFTRGILSNGESLAVALADLIRKGYIRQEDDQSFILINQNVEFDHERLLIEFLFEQVGNGEKFHLEKMRTYTTSIHGYSKYNDFLTNWRRSIRDEIKQENLFRNSSLFRWSIAGLGFLLLITTIIFGVYDHLFYMFMSLMGLIIAVSFAIFYSPKSNKGLQIYMEWKYFSKLLETTNSNQWESLSRTQKERSLVYAIILKDQFRNKLRNIANTDSEEGYNYSFQPWLILSMFHYADTHSYQSSYSSSSGGGGGGIQPSVVSQMVDYYVRVGAMPAPRYSPGTR